ncbi:MAG: hypothetical protein QMC81_11620 [Thermoanaerobacterales bacterium]|nr:hypothetical protein [Thermoanaerobacterales bacterium]
MTVGKDANASWLILRYLPTAMFSVRMTYATNKGGKTLLVPTPYAVKLALVDACFRAFGANKAEARAKQVYELIKGRPVRIGPPRHCVVQNTFIKIKQEERGAPRGIYAPTIAYREFCYYDGELRVALGAGGMSDQDVRDLTEIAARVNYFGKRGSFMQFMGAKFHHGELPRGFTCPESEADIVNGGYRSMHHLDDFGQALIQDPHGFDRINSYGTKPSSLGSYRVLVPTMLPYRYMSSGKHFTHYQLVE